jgi:hypothetical protein
VFPGEYACVFLKSHLFPGLDQNGSAQILQGNKDNKPLHSICWNWNERVNCLACVSDSCARVWSTDGQPVRELNQNGYFRSCSFHPKYENTLVLGGEIKRAFLVKKKGLPIFQSNGLSTTGFISGYSFSFDCTRGPF